ncbi:MAG: hypothetical protein ACJAQ6_000047 [Arenicella sp.]
MAANYYSGYYKTILTTAKVLKMPKDTNDSLSSEATPSSKSAEQQELAVGVEQKNARRTVLRNTLIGGGAVISTSLVPDKWKKPLLDAVILPSHAQTSAAVVVMGGGGGISISKAENDGVDVNDILDIFIGQAYAEEAPITVLNGGCVLLTLEAGVATVSLTLNNNEVDVQKGSVNGTAVSVVGLHSGFTVTATLNSATVPTSATGSISGLGETGAFTVSSSDPVCAPVATTTAAPTTTVAPTTTGAPTTTVAPTTTGVPTTTSTSMPTTSMPTTSMPTTPMPTTPMPANSNVAFNFSLSKSSWA